jgi:hypothetical protein
MTKLIVDLGMGHPEQMVRLRPEIVYHMTKVKQSRYRPGVAQRVLGS